jgi:hypothetical protein
MLIGDLDGLPDIRCPRGDRAINIGEGATLDEQSNNIPMSRQSGLMQAGRVRMAPNRFLPIRIFAGIQQHTHDLYAQTGRRELTLRGGPPGS